MIHDGTINLHSFLQCVFGECEEMLATFGHVLSTITICISYVRCCQASQYVTALVREALSHAFQVDHSAFRVTHRYRALVRLIADLAIKREAGNQCIVEMEQLGETP